MFGDMATRLPQPLALLVAHFPPLVAASAAAFFFASAFSPATIFMKDSKAFLSILLEFLVLA